MNDISIIKDESNIILPGDQIPSRSNYEKSKVMGIECKRPYWPFDDIILTFKGCYIPKKGDIVVGTVLNKHGEFYKISLNTSHDAILSDMAFEGATKRNRPNLITGTYLCCRISYVDIESGEIELTCITPEEKRTWSNNENYLGILKNSNYKNSSIIEDNNNEKTIIDNQSCIRDGMIMNVPLSVAQILLSDKCYIFELLSKYFPYEVCVGQNGVIWFSANSIKEMLLIMSSIKIIPNCTKPQVSSYIISYSKFKYN